MKTFPRSYYVDPKNNWFRFVEFIHNNQLSWSDMIVIEYMVEDEVFETVVISVKDYMKVIMKEYKWIKS